MDRVSNRLTAPTVLRYCLWTGILPLPTSAVNVRCFVCEGMHLASSDRVTRWCGENDIQILGDWIIMLAKAEWLSGCSGRLRTERSWVQTQHRMLTPLVSEGNVMLLCEPMVPGWQPLARVRGNAWWSPTPWVHAYAIRKQTNKTMQTQINHLTSIKVTWHSDRTRIQATLL